MKKQITDRELKLIGIALAQADNIIQQATKGCSLTSVVDCIELVNKLKGKKYAKTNDEVRTRSKRNKRK